MRGDPFDGGLPVGSGIADVARPRPLAIAETALDRLDQIGRIAHRESGLHGIGHRRIGRKIDRGEIVRAAHHGYGACRNLPDRADDLRVSLMADKDDVPSPAVPAVNFGMNLGNQRADRVHDVQTACLGRRFHPPRAAMRGQYRDGARRNVVDLLDEDRALPFQLLDHQLVVDDRTANENRRAIV